MKTDSLIVACTFAVVTSLTACGTSVGTRIIEPSKFDATLNGRVIASEMEPGAGLSDALVTASRDGATYSTRTNENGEFEFAELSTGEWTLSVSREGYVDKVQSVQVDLTEEAVIVAIDPKAEEPISVPDEVLAARAPAFETR